MFRDYFLTSFRSLRARLMLWNAGAVALTGLVILLAVRVGVSKLLNDELDHVLLEDLQEIQLHFNDNHAYHWPAIKEELDRKAEGHDFHRWFVQFYDDNDHVFWSSKNTPPNLPPPTAEQKRAKKFSTSDLRLSYTPLDRPLPEATAVCAGCSQRYVLRDMEIVDGLIMAAGLIVLLASPVVGHLLTSRTIRPLANMIRTTARLHPGEFGERVPVRGTGDELDSLAKTINGLLDRIASYLQQEHDFLANAAHDLRTPLAVIRSSVEVALGVGRTEEEYREILGLVIEQCSALQTLVTQLLLLAETDSDMLRTDPEPVLFDQLVGRAVAMFEGVADDNGIELRCGDLPPVSVAGKRHHLQQVVNNLLDNAIKFTAAASRGEGCDRSDGEYRGCVRVELARDDEARLAHLRIRDNGMGIAAEDLPHVFERFYRADKARGRDGGAGGTGLGLSICKAIVDARGGQITVESKPGDGASFTVTLPLLSATLATPGEETDAMLELP